MVIIYNKSCVWTSRCFAKGYMHVKMVISSIVYKKTIETYLHQAMQKTRACYYTVIIKTKWIINNTKGHKLTKDFAIWKKQMLLHVKIDSDGGGAVIQNSRVRVRYVASMNPDSFFSSCCLGKLSQSDSCQQSSKNKTINKTQWIV